MGADKKPARILCLDDDPASVAVYKSVLEPHGYEVLTACSSTEALEVMLREPIDMLIQDLARPGINGFELYRVMRADEKLQRIRVMICSGHDESRRKFLDLYPDVPCVIEKPFEIVPFVMAVRKTGSVLI